MFSNQLEKGKENYGILVLPNFGGVDTGRGDFQLGKR
jgi:hypothetical protein